MQQTIMLSDLISRDILQELQDAFSRCVGTAALITDASGIPLTRGSGYSRFCSLTRASSFGRRMCAESDKNGGQQVIASGEVSVYHCAMGLLDYAAPIMAGDLCVGTLVGGQVRTGPVDEDRIRKLAEEFLIDPEDYIRAAHEAPEVSERELEKTVQFLADICSVLSRLAYEKYQLIVENRKLRAEGEFHAQLTGRLSEQIEAMIGRLEESGADASAAAELAAEREQLHALLEETTSAGNIAEDVYTGLRHAGEERKLQEAPYDISVMLVNTFRRCVAAKPALEGRLTCIVDDDSPLYLFGDPARVSLIVNRMVYLSLDLRGCTHLRIDVDTYAKAYAIMLRMRFAMKGAEELPVEFTSAGDGAETHEHFAVLAILQAIEDLHGTMETEVREDGAPVVTVLVPQLPTKEYQY